MSPVIRISDPLFKQLQKHATPLVDTPATVIEKILNYYESKGEKSDKSGEKISSTINGEIILNADQPEDLTHAKVINADFGGIKINKWNKLVDVAHIMAKEKYGDFDTLRMNTISNISISPLSDKGFRYVEEAGISIQGENANQTWKSALNLAKKLNVSIEVKFEWRSNKNSAHPGRIGRISWNK